MDLTFILQLVLEGQGLGCLAAENDILGNTGCESFATRSFLRGQRFYRCLGQLQISDRTAGGGQCAVDIKDTYGAGCIVSIIHTAGSVQMGQGHGDTHITIRQSLAGNTGGHTYQAIGIEIIVTVVFQPLGRSQNHRHSTNAGQLILKADHRIGIGIEFHECTLIGLKLQLGIGDIVITVHQFQIVHPELVGGCRLQRVTEIDNHSNAGHLGQISLGKAAEFKQVGLPIIGSEVHAHFRGFLHAITIQIIDLHGQPLMGIDGLGIHSQVGVTADIHRHRKTNTCLGPTHGMLRPHINGISASVGHIFHDLHTGSAAKADGGKHTGTEQIVGIKLSLIDLVGIVHQAIHIHGVTGRDHDADAQNCTAIALGIACKQAHGNRA